MAQARKTSFNYIIPPQGRQLLDGGLNNKFERSVIQPNESPDCLNVIFGGGTAETRPGTTRINSTGAASAAFDGIFTRHTDTGASSLIAVLNASVYVLSGTAFVSLPSALSVFTAGALVGFSEFQNYVFMGNGGAAPYKYNGTNFTRHGIPMPSSNTLSLASGNSGGLTGDYRYKFSYVNSALVEGDVSSATATFTAAAATISVTSIPTAAASLGIIARRLYRTQAGGSSYALVTSIGNNTDTSYSDTVADGSLTTAAPTDQGEPPNYQVVKYHAGRLFVNDPANPNYIVWSEVDNPYVFKADSFIKIGDATSDLVVTFEPYDQHLVVFCRNSVFILYMPSTDDADWVLLRTRSPYGCRSPFGVAAERNRLIFAATEADRFVGFAELQGAALTTDATLLTDAVMGSDLVSQQIEPDIALVPSTMVPKIVMQVYKSKVWIALAYGANQTTNNRVYIYDFSIANLQKRKASWAPQSGIAASMFCIYSSTITWGSATTSGLALKGDQTAYNDDGSAINSYWWGAEVSGLKGHEGYFKNWRRVTLLVEKYGAYFMQLRYRLDSDLSTLGNTQDIDLSPGGSTWGSMIWGSANWSVGQKMEDEKVDLGQSPGERIQVGFSNKNTVNQGFKVHGLTIEYDLRGQR